MTEMNPVQNLSQLSYISINDAREERLRSPCFTKTVFTL